MHSYCSHSDVDTGRANLDADAAINAIALEITFDPHPFARTARLTALRVVGDDQGIGVEHHALEAGIGHMYLQTCSRITPANR
jgi:hypothetical protein